MASDSSPQHPGGRGTPGDPAPPDADRADGAGNVADRQRRDPSEREQDTPPIPGPVDFEKEPDLTRGSRAKA